MIFVILILSSIFLDSSFFSVPLVYILSVLFVRRAFVKYELAKRKTLGYSSHKTEHLDILFPLIVGIAALFCIDVVRMGILGVSPLLFLLSVTLLIVYGRFFEIKKSRFFALFLVGVVGLYAYFLGYDMFATMVFLCILVVGKWILSLYKKNNEKN